MPGQVTMPRHFGAGGRVATCVAFCIVLLASPHHARAAAPVWDRVGITGHGVRLTLFVRHRSYPEDALVRVWARMQNTTGRTLRLYDPGPQAAGKYIPQVSVFASPAAEPLPISLTDYMPYPGPAPLSLPLYPHAVRNIPELAILRGPLLRLDLTFAAGRTLSPRVGPTLSTPVLRVDLTPPDPPLVALHVPPDQPAADITPAAPVRGVLLAVWYYNCDPGYDSAVQENLDWTAIGSHIVPTCPAGSSLVGWHEDAGWLNHSVAEIDWGET